MARNRLWAALKKVAADIDDQFWNRTGPHGAAELGAGLFNSGHPYVMYGHAGRPDDTRTGQPPAKPPPTDPAPGQEPEQKQERKGRER